MLCWLPHLRGSVVSYWQYISTQVGRPHYGTCAMLLQDTTGAVKTSKYSLTIPYHTDWPRGLPKRRNQNLSIVVFICWPFMRKLPLLREQSAFQLSDVKPKPRLSQVTFGRKDIFTGNQWVLRVKTGKQPEARMVYVSRDSDWLKGLRENFLDQSKSDVLPLSGREIKHKERSNEHPTFFPDYIGLNFKFSEVLFTWFISDFTMSHR